MPSKKLPLLQFPKQVKALLVIVPHPDDETAFAAAAIIKAVKAGMHVRAVAVTQGEKSTLRHGMLEHEDLAQVRSAEFKKAVKLLGVTDSRVGSLPDGGLQTERVNLKKFMLEQLQGLAQPAILTLEPAGIYGHPDHIALSEEAALLSEEEKLPLIYATVCPDFQQFPEMLSMSERPELVRPLGPTHELPLSLRQRYLKLKAMRAHSSQFRFTPGFLLRWYKRKLLSREYFYFKEEK